MTYSLNDSPRGPSDVQATDSDSVDPRISAGLAEVAAAAALLRGLDLTDTEPGAAFDPTWPDETSA